MSRSATIAVTVPESIMEKIGPLLTRDGATLSDFIVAALRERVEQLEEARGVAPCEGVPGGEEGIPYHLDLSPQDQKLLADAMEDESVAEPNEFIKNAVREYSRHVVSK